MTATESLLPEIINDFFNKIGTPRRFAAVPKFGPKSLANGRQACQRRARAWSPDSFYLSVHAVFVSN
jgi:hypothetical protein